MFSYILLLLFGKSDRPLNKQPILSYSSIAKVVKLPLETVRRLVRVGLESSETQQTVGYKSRKKL